MSTDNALTNPETTSIAVADEFLSGLPAPTDVKVATDLGGAGIYLPYLTITQGSSPLCAPPYSWPQGNFALKQGRSEVHNLGKELDVFICDWRPKAMFSDKARNVIKAIHDHEDPEFEEFKAKAEEREKGFFWGYEFLLYHGTTGKFMTMFCNNATLRRAAREKGFSYLHKKAIISTKPIQDKDYSWWGIELTPLTTAFDNPLDKECVIAQINAFKSAVHEERPEDGDDAVIDAPPVAGEERPR